MKITITIPDAKASVFGEGIEWKRRGGAPLIDNAASLDHAKLIRETVAEHLRDLGRRYLKAKKERQALEAVHAEAEAEIDAIEIT